MLLVLRRWIGAPDFLSERAGTGLTSLKRKRSSKMLIIQCPPHELPRLVRSVGRLRGGCFWLECWTTPTIPPWPQVSRTGAGGFGFSALCMATGLSRHGDRLDPLTYCVGSGLSSKPSAAAFRFSDFKMLTLTLASYSSIDCVTYSWPYLSIR